MFFRGQPFSYPGITLAKLRDRYLIIHLIGLKFTCTRTHANSNTRTHAYAHGCCVFCFPISRFYQNFDIFIKFGKSEGKPICIGTNGSRSNQHILNVIKQVYHFKLFSQRNCGNCGECFVLFVARAFSYFLFAHAYIIVLYSADVGRTLYINGYYFIFLACSNVCSVTELT